MSVMPTDDFMPTKFFELPWPILRQICSYLDFDQIDQLMDAPQLRGVILDLLGKDDLHIFPADREVKTFWKEKFVTFKKSSIADFFEAYPDISPRTYCVMMQGGFVDGMTPCLHQLLNRVTNIDIWSQEEEREGRPKMVTSPDLRLLLSYPGIQTVELDRSIMEERDVEFASMIPQITNLKSLRLQVKGRTQLPFLSRLAHLECLEIYTLDYYSDDHRDFRADSTYKVLRKVFSQDPFLPGFTSRDLKFPPRLKTLSLNDSCLKKVDVSGLPPTLESLDLSHNRINTFEFESSTPSWPSNLKTIDLSRNHISDKSLKQLLRIQWPPFLETLNLSENKLRCLADLRNLPDSITDLKICGDWKSLQVSHNPDGYPSFKLPKSLRSFCLENHKYYFDDDDDDDDSSDVDDSSDEDDLGGDEELQGRRKFPPNLEHLTLIRASRKDCSRHLIFPPTLKTLHLEEVGIQNLNSYNSLPGDAEVVKWAQLTNLRELNLNHNKISSLVHWCPPRSLRTLKLCKNEMVVLESKMTPLFNEEYRKITQNILQIDLSANLIERIDNNVYLPENLCELTLIDTCLTQFVFTKSIASHRSLVKLDLRLNDISKLSVHSKKKYASQLQELHLYSDAYSVSPDERDRVFKQLGLVPTTLPGERWPPAKTLKWDDIWNAERRRLTFYFKH